LKKLKLKTLLNVKNIQQFQFWNIGCYLSSNNVSVVPPRKSKRLKLQTAK
jgi:hypothetical protein